MVPSLDARLRLALAVLALLLVAPRCDAADQSSACKPIESAALVERIHVRCETAVDGKFAYFAASYADARQANRLLALIVGAELGDKYLSIVFDPLDTSGQTFGCLASDCRTIKGLVIIERVPNRCEIDNTQRGCPAFCAAVGNNDPICPGYCNSHDDMRCAGNCNRHPENPACTPDPPDPCSEPNAPHRPNCPRN